MGLTVQFLVCLFLTVTLTLGCTHPTSRNTPSQAPTDEMALGAGDVFEINVFGEKEMSGKYQVGPDGTVRFPFLGTLQVSGKDAGQVSKEIADGLKNGQYILDPHVSIFIVASNSKRIAVLGAVAKPGMFPVISGMTVVEAVSNAGGFTALASKDETVVTRRVDGKLERYRIAVSDATRGTAEDFPLRPGDIVFVPERVF